MRPLAMHWARNIARSIAQKTTSARIDLPKGIFVVLWIVYEIHARDAFRQDINDIHGDQLTVKSVHLMERTILWRKMVRCACRIWNRFILPKAKCQCWSLDLWLHRNVLLKGFSQETAWNLLVYCVDRGGSVFGTADKACISLPSRSMVRVSPIIAL